MPRRIGNPRSRRRHFIKEWREFRGLTQEELAERMGATKAAISRVETGKAGYTQDFLELCSTALEVEPATLISRPPGDADRLNVNSQSKRDLELSPDSVNDVAKEIAGIIAKALSKAKKEPPPVKKPRTPPPHLRGGIRGTKPRT